MPMTITELRRLLGTLHEDNPIAAWNALNQPAVPPVTNRDHEIAESRLGNTCTADYTNLREEQASLKEEYDRQCASEFRDDKEAE